MPWNFFRERKEKYAFFSKNCNGFLAEFANKKTAPGYSFEEKFFLEIPSLNGEILKKPLFSMSSYNGNTETIIGLLGMEIIRFQFSKDLHYLIYDKDVFQCIGPTDPKTYD